MLRVRISACERLHIGSAVGKGPCARRSARACSVQRETLTSQRQLGRVVARRRARRARGASLRADADEAAELCRQTFSKDADVDRCGADEWCCDVERASEPFAQAFGVDVDDEDAGATHALRDTAKSAHEMRRATHAGDVEADGVPLPISVAQAAAGSAPARAAPEDCAAADASHTTPPPSADGDARMFMALPTPSKAKRMVFFSIPAARSFVGRFFTSVVVGRLMWADDRGLPLEACGPHAEC